MPFDAFQPVNDPNRPGYDWRQMDNVPPHAQPYFQADALSSAAHTITKYRTIAVFAASGKAAANVYRETGDAALAVKTGMYAYVRWTVWAVLLMWSLGLSAFWTLMLAGEYANGPSSATGTTVLGLLATIAVWPFAFGVTWCRNIDFCLFKQGVWYRLFKPVADACDTVNLTLLYLTVLVPFFTLTLWAKSL